MPSSFTPLGVEKMVTGEKSGQWGTLTNANWNLIEQISGGYIFHNALMLQAQESIQLL